MSNDTSSNNQSRVEGAPHDRSSLNRRNLLLLGGTAMAAAAVATPMATTPVRAQSNGRRPNILVIWGDDIGWQNVSAYGLGTMGYTTPNIDRIGNEGIRFTDHYGQPSCTAGRAAFVTGQYPIRSG